VVGFVGERAHSMAAHMGQAIERRQPAMVDPVPLDRAVD
jgi:hypothetical protein